MFCAGRVPEEDLRRTMKACGGSIQTTVQSLTPDVLGNCEIFEEVQIGGERLVFFITALRNNCDYIGFSWAVCLFVYVCPVRK